MTGRLGARGNTLFLAALALSAAAHLLAILLLPGLAPAAPRPERRLFSVTLVQPRPAVPMRSEPRPAAPAPAATREEPAPAAAVDEPIPSEPPETAQAQDTVSPAVFAPAEPAPTADTAARDEAAAIAGILSGLRAAITAQLRYPPLARSRGWQGTALVVARLDGSGALIEAAVRRSSGHELLDRSALALIRSVTPVANPLGRPLSIEIPIAYELR